MCLRLKNSTLGARLHLLGLLLVILLGAFLRFHELGEESLWNDELESWRQSSFGTFAEVLDKGVIPDTHPPAFAAILFLVERGLGTREWQLRLPSAISGTLSVVLVFLIGRRVGGEKVGLLASLFMAVTWAPVYYSQEARNYALLMLLSLAASYLWLEMTLSLSDGKDLGTWGPVGYALSGAATAYTHYFGLMLVGLQALFLLGLALVKRRGVLPVLAAYVAMGLLFVPWLPAMFEQATRTSRIGWIQPPTIRAFPAFISFAFNRSQWVGLIVLALLGWLAWSQVRTLVRERNQRVTSLLTSPEVLLAYWLVAPMVVAYVISRAWSPIFTQRNLLICLAPAYILLARAIFELPFPRLAQSLVGLGIAAFALGNLIFTMGYYREDQKEQFREVVHYVVENHSGASGHPIIGYSRFPQYFDYYFEQFGSDLGIEMTAGETEDVASLEGFLADEDPERIWFISAHRKPDDAFLAALQADYEVIDQRTFVMGEVRLLAPRDG